MTEQGMKLRLMEVLAAAAWADGEISPQEAAVLERTAVDLGLNEHERSEFRRFLDRPVGLEEAETIARDLFGKLSTEERQVWFDRLQGIIAADSRLDPREIKLLETVREAVKGAEEVPSFLNHIRGFFRGGREAEGAAPPVGGVVSQLLDRTQKHGKPAKIDADRLQHASVFGAILYRVAFADGRFGDEEAERLRELLTGTFDFDADEARQVLAVIESRAAEDLDRQRLCASFNRVSDMDARMRLLGCLFMIAEADGQIHEKELREMRLIANYLWIGAKDFNEVRITHRYRGGWRAV